MEAADGPAYPGPAVAREALESTGLLGDGGGVSIGVETLDDEAEEVAVPPWPRRDVFGRRPEALGEARVFRAGLLLLRWIELLWENWGGAEPNCCCCCCCCCGVEGTIVPELAAEGQHVVHVGGVT